MINIFENIDFRFSLLKKKYDMQDNKMIHRRMETLLNIFSSLISLRMTLKDDRNIRVYSKSKI